MRILFLAPQPFYVERGTPIAVRAALEGLSELGHEIDLLAYHAGEDVAIPRVRVRRIRRPPLVRRVPIGPSWQKLVCDAAMLREASRLAQGGGYDLIHAVEEAAFMAGWLRRRFGLPFVYDMDSLMSEQVADKGAIYRPAAAVFGALERWAVRGSIGVLAVCPALVGFARRFHPEGRVALLPDLPLAARPEGRVPAALAEAPGVRLVYVGNLEPYQGVDLMLAAFARAAAQCPKATLVVVGGRPADVERYRRLAGPLAAAGRVRFTGSWPVREIGAVLAAADVLVSPRRAGRNTPMKIYSYLDSGRAVLATRLPTHTQVLDGRVAFLVEPEPQAMASAMVELIRSPALRDRLGAAGREHVRREFGPEAFRRRLRGFYDQVQSRVAPGARCGGASPRGRRRAAGAGADRLTFSAMKEPTMAATPSTMLPLGTRAPEFSLTDAVTGNQVSLDDLADRPALLVMFICNHCPFVKHVAAELARIGRDYGPRGVGIVAINANDAERYPDDSPGKMAEFAAAHGFSFPYLYDATQEVAKAYCAACTPDFYVFDRERRLVYRGQLDDSRPTNGVSVTGRDLRAALDAVLAGAPVPPEQRPSIGCNIKWKPGNEPDYARG